MPRCVARAIELFSANLQYPLSISEVANRAGVSPRNLQRSFKTMLNQTPLQYYRMLRLKQARQLVLYSSDTLTEIAYSVGYSSTSPMLNHYKEVYGVTPQEDRKNRNSFRVTDGSCLPSI